MNRFFRGRASSDEEDLGDEPPILAQRRKPLTADEQRLMFEGSTHWGRGLAILLGMAAVLIIFLIILTVLPRPGDGNPLDSITNLNNSNSSVASSVLSSATPSAGAIARLATVAATPSRGATGTPGPQWVGVARTGVPNVRPAPSTNNQPVGQLAPGRQVQVLGVSADKAWYQIVWDNNTKAWVASDLVNMVSGDATKLPVVSQ